MLNIRLWMIVLVLTLVSKVILNFVGRKVHIGWIFLFWVVAILGSTGFLYMISVWFTSGPLVSGGG